MNWHSLEQFCTGYAAFICLFAIGLAVVFRKDQQRRDARTVQQRALDRTNVYIEKQQRIERTHSSPTYTYTRKS